MKENEFKSLMRKYGFEYCRSNSTSHEVWKNCKGETFTVPCGREIKMGILWQFKRKYIKK